MTVPTSLFQFVNAADLDTVRKRAKELEHARASRDADRVANAEADHCAAATNALASAGRRLEAEYVAAASRLSELWEAMYGAQNWTANAAEEPLIDTSNFETAVVPAPKRVAVKPLKTKTGYLQALFVGTHASELARPERAYQRLIADWSGAGLPWPSQWRSR